MFEMSRLHPNTTFCGVQLATVRKQSEKQPAVTHDVSTQTSDVDVYCHVSEAKKALPMQHLFKLGTHALCCAACC